MLICCSAWPTPIAVFMMSQSLLPTAHSEPGLHLWVDYCRTDSNGPDSFLHVWKSFYGWNLTKILVSGGGKISPEERTMGSLSWRTGWVLDHAELVPCCDLTSPPRDVFYLPTYGVVKENSSTKLHIVYDGSAETTNSRSLNDILLSGPFLYPLLSRVIAQLRVYKVEMTSDISKMFREISLNERDGDLHQFCMRILRARYKAGVWNVSHSASPHLHF